MKPEMFELYEEFPGRETEIEKLYQLYGHTDEISPDALYIYGITNTGKTSVVTRSLQVLNIKHSVVNLIRCNTIRLLFEEILSQLNNSDSDSEYQTFKCDSLMEFLPLLKKCVSTEKIVLVLDKAERLRNMDMNLFPAFLRLRELSGLNVSVIFISTLEFCKLIQKMNVAIPIILHFRQYTREETLKILMKNLNKSILDAGDDFYMNYLNVLLSVFYRNCRDLCELLYQAQLNLPKYCEPVISGTIKPNDVSKLWHKIAPTLKTSLEAVYLRTQSSPMSHDISVVNTPLPFYAKYLLIAAYLASYNPAKEDKRLFTKNHGKKRKTLTQMKMKNKVTELLNTQLGPKPFTFDRLLAIFFSILEDKVGLCSNVMSQLSSLVQMQLLTTVGDGINLDGQKFKCNVDLEHMQIICKTVGFNIRKYLYDFI